MKQITLLFGIFILSLWLLSLGSCKHQPWIPDGIIPIDTTGTGGTDTTGTGGTAGNPCSPDSVYFAMQILPILQSSCAMSGCHDAASAQDGVILTSYANVMNTADVRPFDLDGSDLYEAITENDPDKIMPPPPSASLSAAQIALIAKWINQGAQDLSCDANAGGCNTANMSFANDIKPIVTNKCAGCHSGNNPSGGINLSTHAGVSAVALSGQLYGSINWQTGFSNMPKNGAKLPQCEIDKIKSWVDAGAPNN
jgi:uncharacterized membrane protein